MNFNIRNIDDLHGEISRLTDLHQEQKIALGHRFSSPSAIFSTVLTLFPKGVANGVRGAGFIGQDLVSLISRIALPLTLNKTIFRHSGFIIKTLVGLVSQKASNFITEDSVSSVWNKAKLLFNKVTGKNKKPKNMQGYGIPAV